MHTSYFHLYFALHFYVIRQAKISGFWLTIYSRNSVLSLSNQFPWNVNIHHTVIFGFSCLAQFIKWNRCYNITWKNKILFIRKLSVNTIEAEFKSHLENELNQLLKTWNSTGVKRTEPHKIYSNSSMSGRIPAIKSSYSNIDFQVLSE